MYAVIEAGGKQYRVELGTELEVERLDIEAGQSVTLDRVLLVADGDEATIGRPLVENAAVEAEVVRQARGDKVIVFKYRPKARRRVKKGHRQDLTLLRVTDVRLNGRSAAEAARKAETDARTERQRLEEAAARQAAEDAKLAARLSQARKAEPDAAQQKTAGAAGAGARRPKAGTSPDKAGKAKVTPASDAPGGRPRRAPTKAAPRETGGEQGKRTDEPTDENAGASQVSRTPRRSRPKKSE
jgi:large subunit ribosomal protein L21